MTSFTGTRVDYTFTPGVDEGADVVHALGVGFAEIRATGLVPDDALAGPEEVDEVSVDGEFFDALLKGGTVAAFFYVEY